MGTETRKRPFDRKPGPQRRLFEEDGAHPSVSETGHRLRFLLRGCRELEQVDELGGVEVGDAQQITHHTTSCTALRRRPTPSSASEALRLSGGASRTVDGVTLLTI